ncbi:hypothetical protein K2Z83_06650 [Oscillochloris sp. ZM17-4]|uniref:hypothetical protein n=1 Tax=Oscillochloris sp. ZM17-4 TaxID=2866714 RepID=UPI001C736791|nr:hypothetical protein [Oscillochloris sp. ZM17-4]MBX0327354.1 hypothetical protein [Oscillochloris sp. ZM17-4]
MNYRFRAYEAQVQPPSALRIMTALVIAFVLVSLLILLAGRLPFTPAPLVDTGTTYRQYVARDTELLSTYGNTIEGNVHIPIDRAMQLIVERGLPVRDNPSPTP